MEQNKYVVALRAPSGAKFDPDEPPLTLIDFPTDVGPATFTIRTRYVDEGFEVPVPRELWVDARGTAPSLTDAINGFWNAAQALLNVVSVSANASIGDLDWHVAYDATPGRIEHEFIQQFLPDERGIQHQGRRVNVAATVALFQALAPHRERERLLRAIVQYHLALTFWKPGYQALALAHLYMGMEALTKAALRERCRADGLTEEELAAAWGIEKRQLDPEVRRRLLFQGDAPCYDAARKASDGLEHGFLAFPAIRAHADAVRDQTASYLRTAIVDLLEIEASVRQLLLSPPYHRPLEWWPITMYLRGRLRGAADALAPDGQEYPLMRWERRVKAISRRSTGEYDIQIEPNFTAQIGEGVEFWPDSHEVWGPEKEPPQPPSSSSEGAGT